MLIFSRDGLHFDYCQATPLLYIGFQSRLLHIWCVWERVISHIVQQQLFYYGFEKDFTISSQVTTNLQQLIMETFRQIFLKFL